MVVADEAERRAIGPYRIVERLGSGGMGTVYRATKEGSGALVALKTVKLPDPRGLRSLRREIHALRRIKHPGIVEIVDEGVEAGSPWYAMELLEGRTLRRFLEDLWRPGVAVAAAGQLGSVLTLVRRLCDALAFLHGEGLVHRDLKPENIFTRTGDAQPVLVDFGFVASFGGARGRESIDVAGVLEGSFGYMAPEQISGDLVDARADLYALGCLVYELLAGRPVFSGEGWEAARQHLGAAPDPPSRWVAGVPPELDALVLHLLAKRPRERIGYAEDVALALARLGSERSDPARGTNAYLYRPELAGRADLLDEAEQILDEAKLGRGRFVLFGGESGAGKTRLAMEIGTIANRRGLRVVTGECLPIDARQLPGGQVLDAPLHPFKPLLQAMSDECHTRGPQVTEALLGSGARVLALYESTLGDVPSRGPQVELRPLGGPEARRRVVDVFAQTFAAFASDQALLLVIDDLQWADDLTLEVLSALTRSARDRAAVILGTYRPEEERDALRPLLATSGIVHRRLRRLDEAAVSAMVEDMLALSSPPRAFIHFLAEQSSGNPFFVAEYLRAAASEALLSRDSEGHWRIAERTQALERLPEALPFPASLRDLVSRWIEGLRPRPQALAELAAVLGREFDEDLLEPEAGSDDVSLLEDLEELRRRNVLEEIEPGRLRFTHDKLREITYAAISTTRRRALHEAAATRIEARQAGPVSYGTLAHHWMMAEDDARSFDYLERAGAHALALGAAGAAVDFFERALALATRGGHAGRTQVDPARCASWRCSLGESWLVLGDLARAQKQMLRTLAELGLSLPASMAGWATSLGRQLSIQAVHLVGLTAGGEPDAARSRLMTGARAASRLCECFYYQQDLLAVTVAAVLAVNLAERAGIRGEVRRQYAQLGYLAGLLRIHPLARRYFRQSREGELRADDPVGAGVALYYEASYEATFCRWERAASLADASIARLRALGDEHELQIAQAMRTHIDYFTGQFAEAVPRLEQMRTAARTRDNAQLEAWSAYGVARSLIPLGRLDEAVERLNEARSLLGRQTDRSSQIICHGLLADALFQNGDFEGSRSAAGEVLRLGRGGNPAVLTEGHGYEGAATALLGLWAREGSAPRSAALAREACSMLSRFGQLFPLAYPASLRCRGVELALSGRLRLGRAILAHALRAAQKGKIPYDEARAHFELGKWAALGLDREGHLRSARAAFARLGCELHLREVDVARSRTLAQLVEE